MKKRILSILILLLAVFLISCKSDSNKNDDLPNNDENGNVDDNKDKENDNENDKDDDEDLEDDENYDVTLSFDEEKFNKYMNILNNFSNNYHLTRKGNIVGVNELGGKESTTSISIDEDIYSAKSIYVYNANNEIKAGYDGDLSLLNHKTNGVLYYYNDEAFFKGKSVGTIKDNIDPGFVGPEILPYELDGGLFLLTDFEDYYYDLSFTLEGKGAYILEYFIYDLIDFYLDDELISYAYYNPAFKMIENEKENTFKFELNINNDTKYFFDDEFFSRLFDIDLNTIEDIDLNVLIEFKNDALYNINANLKLESEFGINNIISNESFNYDFDFKMPKIDNLSDYEEIVLDDIVENN